MENLMKKVIKGVAYTWAFLTLAIATFMFVAFVNHNFETVQVKLNFLSASTVEADKIAFNQLEKNKQETAEALAATNALAESAHRKPTLDSKISKVLLEKKASVVYVDTSIKDEYREEAERLGAGGNSLGTGWFVEVTPEYAYVVTNHHVIEPYLKASKWLNIGIYDLDTPWLYDVEIVGYDVVADIAVLKVANYENSGWTAFEWADHDKTAEGDPVVAIGHGLSLPWSMSSGIITALDRWMIRPMNMMIQTDTVVNKGNSGGPLLNLNGEVVGVVDALLDPGGMGNEGQTAAYAGVSLIIAGWQAEKAVNEIIEYGEASYPYFDFKLRNPEREEYAMQWGTELGKSMVLIADTGEQSSNLGLQEGDWVLEFDGKPLTGMVSLVKMVLTHRPGDMVRIKVQRDGNNHIYYYTLENFKDYQK